jgi:hypothetical protein
VRLYVHDDLTDDVRVRHGDDSAALALTRALLDLVRRDAGRVSVITVDEQTDRLIARGTTPAVRARHRHRPGRRAGGGPGARAHGLVSRGPSRGRHARGNRPGPLPAHQHHRGAGGRPADRAGARAVAAVVDDTIFSGLTMRTLLSMLPASVRFSGRRWRVGFIVGAPPPRYS